MLNDIIIIIIIVIIIIYSAVVFNMVIGWWSFCPAKKICFCLSRKWEVMGLEENHPYLVSFDGFRGQQTPAFQELLEKNNTNHINVPAICTDKLQPLDLSVNKPLKDKMKQCFQAWYAEKVQKQIASGTAIPDTKIDIRTSILKPKSANWLIGTLDSLSHKPEIVISVFRMAAIVHALEADGQ